MMFPLFLMSLLVLRQRGLMVLVRNGSSTMRPSFLLPRTTAAPLQATLRREDDNDDPLLESMRKIGWTQPQQDALLQALHKAGLWDSNDSGSSGSSSHALLTICRHLEPESITRMLVDDFSMTPLMAHQIRAAVVQTFCQEMTESVLHRPTTSAVTNERATKHVKNATDEEENTSATTATAAASSATDTDKNVTETPQRRALYKSVVVNTAAKRRHQKQQHSSSYGLSQKDLVTEFPKLAIELDNFYTFMTQPTTGAQDDPIRPATATVYLQHARLFLGWYVRHNKILSKKDLSLFDIIPNKNQESASCVVDFILWLRSERHISVSYEANLLRGLTKLVKFRFAKESRQDGDAALHTRFSGNSYQDIPAVQELRKLHRVANQQQKNAPRSSDEDAKWLDWPDYLQVVQQTRTHLEKLLKEYNDNEKTKSAMTESNNEVTATPQQRKIAIAFQKYLVLAFFANVPDRQRTIRELTIGRSFVKDKASDCWVIRHAPDDYKTGKIYGERPPLRLSSVLTDAIDTFLKEWRPCLRPSTDKLFVQPRTGNPLTRDSIYQIVGRVCHQYTGKRTNPHLLRDMIVTHVRESSDASEKELEALALYMGHSIHMQRTSYDRRTLTKKVAPAVELLEAVNSNTLSSIENSNKDKKSL